MGMKTNVEEEMKKEKIKRRGRQEKQNIRVFSLLYHSTIKKLSIK